MLRSEPLERLHIELAVDDRYADDARTGELERLESRQIARLLHEHGVARIYQSHRQKPQRLLRARRDHHGRVGCVESRSPVALGDDAAKLRITLRGGVLQIRGVLQRLPERGLKSFEIEQFGCRQPAAERDDAGPARPGEQLPDGGGASARRAGRRLWKCADGGGGAQVRHHHAFVADRTVGIFSTRYQRARGAMAVCLSAALRPRASAG